MLSSFRAIKAISTYLRLEVALRFTRPSRTTHDGARFGRMAVLWWLIVGRFRACGNQCEHCSQFLVGSSIDSQWNPSRQVSFLANATGKAPALKQFLCEALRVYAVGSNAFVDMLANGKSWRLASIKALVAAARAAIMVPGSEMVVKP